MRVRSRLLPAVGALLAVLIGTGLPAQAAPAVVLSVGHIDALYPLYQASQLRDYVYDNTITPPVARNSSITDLLNARMSTCSPLLQRTSPAQRRREPPHPLSRASELVGNGTASPRPPPQVCDDTPSSLSDDHATLYPR